jgi:hypothetical protein
MAENDDSKVWDIGGGSGGDAGMTNDGNLVKTATGTYQIGGNQVFLVSRKGTPPVGGTGPSQIMLLAGGSPQGTFMDDGNVYVRGCNGVRITAGQPPLLQPFTSPPVTSDLTTGIEMVVANSQNIMIQRGALIESSTTNSIELSPQGVYVDAQATVVSVKSLQQITLSVANGACSITLTPLGIILKGPIIKIN